MQIIVVSVFNDLGSQIFMCSNNTLRLSTLKSEDILVASANPNQGI